MESASRATIARDPACSPGSTKTVPLTSSGSPDQALTSILGALRRPRTAGGTPSWIEEVLPGAGPGGPIGSRPASGADAYVNAIRLARTALGVTFYILPAGEETGLRATPEWCDAEQSRVLGHILKTDPAARRQRVGQLQHEYLTWQRYEALNPEGSSSSRATLGLSGMTAVPARPNSHNMDCSTGTPVAPVARS